MRGDEEMACMREKREEENETEKGGGATEGGRGPSDKGIKKTTDKQTNKLTMLRREDRGTDN